MGSSKVTKADLIQAIYLSSSVSKKDIHVVLDQLIEVIKDKLSEDNIIELRGLGTFFLKQRKGRAKARNPKTGEVVSIGSHCVAAFKSGKELKGRVWDVKKEDKK